MCISLIFSNFHTVSRKDSVVYDPITNAHQVHSAAVENISLNKMRQKNEAVVQSDFPMEHRFSFLSNQHAEIFGCEDALSLKGQVSNKLWDWGIHCFFFT